MDIDAEKWDNNIQYAYKNMIEIDKEKVYKVRKNEYECNCGNEVLNKDKEEHENNDSIIYTTKNAILKEVKILLMEVNI